MHYSSLNSPENHFKLFIAPVTWNFGAQLWLTTKQVWPNSSWGARQGPVLGRICSYLGSNASHRHLCLIHRTAPPFAHAGNIATFYCTVSHTHKARGYPHLFLVKNVFYRDICIEIFSCFSSCGMPSTCIALAATVYFLLYPEDYLPLALSYRRIHINKPGQPGPSFLFFLNLLSCTWSLD